ncbi:MAG TPA: DUF3800 domain-containing protein [Rhodothermales bacterium]|nr:DUF3800 domain-containing protein [Rhodothermales bacterium]
MKRVHIYCDESGHLERDEVGVMVLGALWHDGDKTREIAERLRELKTKHGLARDFEVKWVKVSEGRRDLYLSVLDYFFDDDDLHFRAVVIPDRDGVKDKGEGHDDWYYRMYLDLLKVIVEPKAENYIYVDIKDTRGAEKVRQLHEALRESHFDFNRSIIGRIQQVRSHEVEQVQLADLLIGAVSYANRGLSTNSAKAAFVARMRKRSGHVLTKSTLFKEKKVNVFVLQPGN